jgi:hypothetical protein
VTPKIARAVLVVAALAAGGCVFQGKPVTAGPPGSGASIGVGATRGWAIKEVVEKQAPRSLLARDGTRCDVSEDRYKETRVGAQVQCEWR